MKQEGDACIQPATWFVSHAWRYKFLDLVKALEEFFADKGGGVVVWLDLFSVRLSASTPRSRNRPSGGSRRSSPPSVELVGW